MSDIYTKVVSDILDLVSTKYEKTSSYGVGREGHDTMMGGIDEQAIEILKLWVADNLTKILTEVMKSEEFIDAFLNIQTKQEISISPNCKDFSKGKIK